MIKVAIIEDDKKYREKLIIHFKKSNIIECVLAVDSIRALDLLYRTTSKIDILLLDIVLGDMSGIKGISKIRKLDKNIPIIMLTNHLEHEKIFQSITAGAVGYLIKASPLFKISEEIILLYRNKSSALNPQVARIILDYFSKKSKVSFVNNKEKSISEVESKIINYVIEGLSYQEISTLLNLSYNGVQYHVRKIYSKIQIRSRGGLIKKFINGDIDFS